MFAFEFLFDVVCVVLVNIENNKFFGVVRSNLAAKLASYRAASARNEYHFVFYVTDDCVDVYGYGVAP